MAIGVESGGMASDDKSAQAGPGGMASNMARLAAEGAQHVAPRQASARHGRDMDATWTRHRRDMDATKAGHQGGTGDADAGRLLSWASMDGGIATHPSVMPTAMTAVR